MFSRKSFLAVFAMLLVLIAFMPNASALRGWQGTSGSPEQFLIEVEKGNIPGHSIVHVHGHATVATTLVPITNALVYQTPTAAVSLEVVSADADDTSAGAGARTVWIEGLALDGSVVTQTVSMNGLTAVPIPTDLWRLIHWEVATSGVYATTTTGSHEGVLTIRVAGAGATWSTIPVVAYPHSHAEDGWYTIPNGYRGYILSMSATADSTKSIDVVILKREEADIVVAPFSTMKVVADATGVAGEVRISETRSVMNALGEMTDLGFMGKVGSSTGDITVHMELLLIKDGY